MIKIGLFFSLRNNWRSKGFIKINESNSIFSFGIFEDEDEEIFEDGTLYLNLFSHKDITFKPRRLNLKTKKKEKDWYII